VASMADPAISTETIAAAERLAGVTYTAAERAQMLGTIAAPLELTLQRRGMALPAALPPATRFDPRLPGFAMPSAGQFVPDDGEAPPAVEEDTAAIAYAPLTTLARWLRARMLTSRRLTEIYLDRITRIAPGLQCFATLTPDLALAQADRADRLLADGTDLGPLHGIPWGCKDILDTAGVVTGWGAEPWRDRMPEADATVVRLLREAGAVLLGKLAVGALAYGDIWYGGRTRNPWNSDEGSSGSSAGSASATAAGLVGFSLGTETVGSIVAPALRCGVTGLRPTFGRVSRTGAMPLCWTLDKIGVLTRAVEDSALVLHVLNAPDPDDPCQIHAPFNHDARKPVAGTRLGYYEADFAEAIDLDRAALETARALGVELVALQRPDLPYAALMSTLHVEAAASFEDMTLSGRDDELTWQDARAWPNTFRCARFVSAVDHVQADRLRRHVMQDMDAAFHEVDAMIGPVLIGPMLVITNFTGHPCLVVRSGFQQLTTRGHVLFDRAGIDWGKATKGTEHTVPHGICLYGRLYDESTILRLGRALERAFGVAERRPPVG
jgi:Asp-tRNA(Asn)/Glu-tRNA(Gln) amidotransferase A subunit family amidase